LTNQVKFWQEGRKMVNDNIDVNYWLKEIQQDPAIFKYVPELKTEVWCLVTEALRLAIVKKDGSALEYVPESLKTEAMCFAAVQQDGRALDYVPESLKTEAMCIAVVKQNGFALQFVPESSKTEAVCLAAVTEDGQAFELVPEPLRTEAVCLAAVQENGYVLKHVPESLRTEAQCLAAVKRSGGALEYVPKALRTEPMCIAAMQENSWAFKYIPKNLIAQVKAQTKYGTFFDEQRIKEILIAIRDTNDNFEVLIKDERRQTKRGCYYSSHRIELYLFEYDSNNDLIQCAIHEYAHHILRECKVKHQTEFWTCYFELLAEAEKKEFYSCNIDKSGKLKKITNIIKQNDLLKNKKIFKEGFKDIIFIIKKLCEEIDIDFQYYTVKYLEMDWYKKKNPYLAFNNFHRNFYLFGKRGKELDDLLDDFFKVYSVE
jgi:hypothetical protein